MDREQVREQLYREVGGFFTNTVRGENTCVVCTGPAHGELCGRCADHRLRYGDQLADQVVPLAYALGNMAPPHQSVHHMYRYKHRIAPSAECLRDLKLMVLAGTGLHGRCMARSHGWWEVVTFVSSADRPGPMHPVVELAKQVSPAARPVAKVLLDIGPGIAADPKRFPLPDRFEVAGRWRRQVRGRHVLVVDDTWVSGDKGQSAALALKAAGARAVTVVCVARWLSWTYSAEHQQLIRACSAPYDALRCPVTGGVCPPSD